MTQPEYLDGTPDGYLWTNDLTEAAGGKVWVDQE